MIDEDPPQTITVDNDIRSIKRAIVFGESLLKEGVILTKRIGVKCDRCHQEGLLYHQNRQTKILVCSHVYAGLYELLEKLERERWERDWIGSVYTQTYKCGVVVGGVQVEKVRCGKDLMLHLRMNHCWFPGGPHA